MKTKVIAGIALVLFVFISVNIIAIGTIQENSKKNQEGSLSIIKKDDNVQLTPIIEKNVTPENKTNTSKTTTTTKTTTSSTTTTKPKKTTRAS